MVQARYQTAFRLYPYAKVADQAASTPRRHPVVIIGGGPVGMGLALDLGKKGIPCLVLDDHDGVGMGSRAICFAKRTLEICDRLGCGEQMVQKGVVWNLGRVYRGEREVYHFNLLPEEGHKRPAFINLQQPYFEQCLVEEIRAEQAKGAPVEIRGKNRLIGLEQKDDHVLIQVDTPDGPYEIEAEYLVACDGASSPTRDLMGLGFDGRTFEDNFLIADIKMKADFPTERRFWFDPPFNRGKTALMHKQPDRVWRLDFQLGWDIDRAAEIDPDKIKSRVAAMIGKDIDFELVWTSIYTFRCASMEQYRHDRVFFAGDSAHQVSPFGARGCNGGMQDIDNLAWKLAMVINGQADDSLLDSYHEERKYGADENIRNSSRTADFLTPRNPAHVLFRDAVLDLVEHYEFALPLVNSGRLSTPCTYDGSSLNSMDALPNGPMRSRPGSPMPDAPIEDGYLLDYVATGRFSVLGINCDLPEHIQLKSYTLPCLSLRSERDVLAERYLGEAQSAVFLIRPDQHIAGRWPELNTLALEHAFETATGGS